MDGTQWSECTIPGGSAYCLHHLFCKLKSSAATTSSSKGSTTSFLFSSDSRWYNNWLVTWLWLDAVRTGSLLWRVGILRTNAWLNGGLCRHWCSVGTGRKYVSCSFNCDSKCVDVLIQMEKTYDCSDNSPAPPKHPGVVIHAGSRTLGCYST
jgi:hypothetical protein